MPLLLRRRTRARLSTPGSPDSFGATCSSGGTRTGRPGGAGSPRLTRSGPPGRGCPADAGGSGDEPRLRASWPRQAIRRHRGKGLHVRSALSPRERLRVGDRHRAGGGEEGRDPGCVTVVGVKGGGFRPRLGKPVPFFFAHKLIPRPPPRQARKPSAGLCGLFPLPPGVLRPGERACPTRTPLAAATGSTRDSRSSDATRFMELTKIGRRPGGDFRLGSRGGLLRPALLHSVRAAAPRDPTAAWPAPSALPP